MAQSFLPKSYDSRLQTVSLKLKVLKFCFTEVKSYVIVKGFEICQKSKKSFSHVPNMSYRHFCTFMRAND